MARLPRSPGQRQGVARRMTTGVAGGRSAVVAPTPPRPRQMITAQPITEVAVFSQSGALAVTASDDAPSWIVETGGLVDVLEGALKVAGSSSSVFTAYLNGASIGTVTLTSSDTYEADGITPVWANPGDVVSVRCTTAGTGAKSASIKIPMRR